ncbi:MAG: hypothetical protein LDL41_16265 [Coleofasciculus sp. S288]|nr:hypothetical protein [Coleofasciculus sp. S288]
MLFQFAPAVQAAIMSGKYVQVFTSAGVPIGMARDAVTGQFVAHAIGAVIQNSPLSPLLAASQFVTTGAQMVQTHMGFQGVNRRVEGVSQQVVGVSQQVAGVSQQVVGVSQQVAGVSQQVAGIDAGLQSLQASVGVLQATTAMIGVGTVAGVALSAVNLWQTLKLREDVKQLKLEVKNGFIDLKKALKDQGTEIIQRIDEVAQDIKFEQHRLVLIQAYGRFLEATKLMKIALSCKDVSIKNADLANARQMLAEALADYNNPRLLSETSAAGQLRRMECAWAIEQTIVLTYQLQDEPAAVSDRLSHLQDKIRQDSLTVINRCETEDELDFLFPEITRIHDHDLAVLESWQNHVDWMRSLPPSELKLLQSADFDNSEVTANSDTNTDTTALAEPLEQLLYENLKQKSHPASLRDQMVLMMKPALRQEFESYISQQSAIAGYKTLVPANLQKASDLAVANLYWYFKVRDESEAEAVTA